VYAGIIQGKGNRSIVEKHGTPVSLWDLYIVLQWLGFINTSLGIRVLNLRANDCLTLFYSFMSVLVDSCSILFSSSIILSISVFLPEMNIPTSDDMKNTT
jgi:hypothetical protein